MTEEQILEANFRDALSLPDDASAYLLDLWRVIQAFDDVADGDDVEDWSAAVFSSLAGIPCNSFFMQHIAWLAPVQALAVAKWFAANAAERDGKADARSYMWRAGYYDLVCMVTAIVHGPQSDKVRAALECYGESLEDYLKEFGNA